jgi:eukaryotic-like serine/threonine-protein kinase
MSVVYRARDPVTDRMVALTVPSAESSDSPELLARFYREARAAGSLQHPNIIAVYDLGVDRGSPYIAMELLEGADLEQIVEREKKEGTQSPQSAATLLNYVIQACRGLAFAHQNGVIHRDVRPGNIFVAKDGRVKLTHFVNARLPDAHSPISAGMLGGTAEYMSPEHFRGDRMDSGTDIWAVGCMLYEILTYTKPFQFENNTAGMIAIMSQEPKPICELRPDLPAKLDKVLRRCLKKVRGERYRNMDELVADLEPIVHQMQSAGATE